MPKVSVIIPIYGVENYIERCARSLFEQTLDDIEFIFVDDYTPDNSIKILENLIEKYPNRKSQVYIVKHEKNKGLPIARQSGLKLAKGEYIAHCDSDDWVDTDMYRSMYEKAKIENADVIVCDFCKSDGENYTRIKTCHSTEKIQFIENCFVGIDYWAVWNKLVKRDLYTDNFIFPLGNMGEDMVLTVQLILASKHISHINRSFYYYFNNPNSICKKVSEDTCYKRFSQAVENAHIVETILNRDSSVRKRLNKSLIWMKYREKNLLKTLIKIEKYYQIWKSTFPELNKQVLFNPYIPLKTKICFYLTTFNLHRKLR